MHIQKHVFPNVFAGHNIDCIQTIDAASGTSKFIKPAFFEMTSKGQLPSGNYSSDLWPQ